LKELNARMIISQGVYNSPLIDRRVQSVLLHIMNYLVNEYGFSTVSIKNIQKIANEILGEERLKSLTRKCFEKFIDVFNEYDISKRVSDDVLELEPFLLKNVEPDLIVDENLIEASCSRVYSMCKPTYLMQRLENASKLIADLSTRRVEFLSTSKIHKSKEISDKLAEMIDNAYKHVYMMLAFYQEDVSFLSNFLGNKVRNSKLELKIIYNPKDKKNREFIKQLFTIVRPHQDFSRVYGPKHLKDEYEGKFIGNLHSKAVMTEAELLVGSANLTGMSMYYNVENAIYTNDPESVRSANRFFISLWDKLRPVYAI